MAAPLQVIMRAPGELAVTEYAPIQQLYRRAELPEPPQFVSTMEHWMIWSTHRLVAYGATRLLEASIEQSPPRPTERQRPFSPTPPDRFAVLLIDQLLVDPEHRRSGLALLLLQMIVGESTNAGYGCAAFRCPGSVVPSLMRAGWLPLEQLEKAAPDTVLLVLPMDWPAELSAVSKLPASFRAGLMAR
ncbi:MAG: hypothetical protein NVSMB42_19530 [Herpetosiphon sp.]